MHRTLLENLKSRTGQRKRCLCYGLAAQQLWLCFEIGFGTKRDAQKAAQWLSRCNNGAFEPTAKLEAIEKDYVPSNPVRLNHKMGYEANLPFDPVALYLAQGRLKEAEVAFRNEVSGRKESLGTKSSSYLSQSSTLSIILVANKRLEEAVQVSQAAVEAFKEIYGSEDIETIGILNYHSYILFQAGKWSELEALQLELIDVKERHHEIGPTDPTTLNSRNYLAAVYCLQGRYNECLDVALPLAAFRDEHLSPGHPETLTTKTWICRALLEKWDIEELQSLAEGLVTATAKAMGADAEETFQAKEILAAVYLGLSLPKTNC